MTLASYHNGISHENKLSVSRCMEEAECVITGCVRVELIQELDPGDPTLEIPWTSDVKMEARYVDLKRFPRKIQTIRECRRHPALADLLRIANAAGGPFRTAKCDVWTTRRLAEDERVDFPLGFKVGSYVDLVFESPLLYLRVEPYMELSQRLECLLRTCRAQAAVELALRMCLFHPEHIWGYYFTIYVHAYGANRKEAKEEWQRAIDHLKESLASLNSSFQMESKKSPSRMRHRR